MISRWISSKPLPGVGALSLHMLKAPNSMGGSVIGGAIRNLYNKERDNAPAP